MGIILNIFSFRNNLSPSFDVMTDIWRIISTFFCFTRVLRWRVAVFNFKPHSFAISSLVKNPSGLGGATFVRIAETKSSCQGFRGDFIRRILCLWADGTCCLVVLLEIHRGSCLDRLHHKPIRVASEVSAVGLYCIREFCCRGIQCCTRFEGRWIRYGNNQWRVYAQR